MNEAWHPIGSADDYFDGHASAVVAGGIGIVVVRQGNALYALRDRCTHGMARLSDGWVEDGCIECPLHQGRFDLRTGAALCAPVTEADARVPGSGGRRLRRSRHRRAHGSAVM